MRAAEAQLGGMGECRLDDGEEKGFLVPEG